MSSAKKHAEFNAQSLRKLQNEMDAQREMERMHLRTIRSEKVRLQRELEKVRIKGHNTVGRNLTTTKTTKLLNTRLSNQKKIGVAQSLNIDDRPRNEVMSHSTSSHEVFRKDTDSGTSPNNGIDIYPLEAEYRKKAKEFENLVKMRQNVQNKQRSKQEQSDIALRIEEFSNSFIPRSPRQVTPPEDEVYEEIIDLGDNWLNCPSSVSGQSEGGSHSSCSSSKRIRNKSRQKSIADYDMNQAKNSVAKRLLPVEIPSLDLPLSGISTSSSSTVMSFRHSQRHSTRVAILERDQVNKYAPMSVEVLSEISQSDVSQLESDNKNFENTTDIQSSPQSQSEKESQIQLNFAGVGETIKRKVLEVIENPELQFDDRTYAPDGALRTVHTLPSSEDAFSEASKARYLRWRDPMKRDRELSIGEIFAKDDSGQYKTDSFDS